LEVEHCWQFASIGGRWHLCFAAHVKWEMILPLEEFVNLMCQFPLECCEIVYLAAKLPRCPFLATPKTLSHWCQTENGRKFMCFYSGSHADYLKEEVGGGITRSADIM